MKNFRLKSSVVVLGLAFLLSACGGSDSSDGDGGAQSDPVELESDGKTLIFYSASTNEQYAYNVDTQGVLNLQDATDSSGDDISNFNMSADEHGKLFVWMDNKGDTNASNDEGKIIMLKNSYNYATDGNASWEDFYYLGHFHQSTDGLSYDLAAHDSSEFNVTSGAKYSAILRFNEYLAEQKSLEQNLSATIPAAANGLCGFHTFVNEEGETFYYAMGNNGTIYVYDENISSQYLDSVAVSDSCMQNEFGMSSTEDGVLLFLTSTQKVYSVDSHADGVYHVHNSWNLSELLGDGKSAEMMVGIEPLRD